MARQEIFSTEIRFDTDQIEGAIKEIEKFRDSVLGVAQDIEKAFAKISLAGFAGKGLEVEFDKQARAAQGMAKEVDKAAKQVKTSFQKIELPDIFFEVQSQIRTLGDKTSPEIAKIRDQFNQLRQEAKTGLKITGEIDPRTVREIADLQSRLRRLKELELEELEAQFNRVSDVGSVAGTSVAGAFNQAAQSVEKLSESRNILEFGQSIQATVANVQNFQTRLQDAIRLGGEGGNRLLALRTAMFGFGDSTNVVARVLDRFTAGISSANKEQSEFARFGFRAAEEIARFNNVLETNAKTFAVLAREQGVEAGRLNQLRRGVVEVENAFEKAARAFARGRDATTQLLEAEQAASRFREEIEALRRLDILDERSLKQLAELERSLTAANQGVKVLTVTQRQLKAEQEAAKRAVQQLGKETADLGKDAQNTTRSFTLFGGSFKKALGDLFNFNRGTEKATREIRLMAQTAQTAGRAVRDLFSGAFLGGLAGNLLFELGSRARFAFGGLIELGSAAQELDNRFNVVFDAQSGLAARVIEQLDLMANSFGRNITDLKETASTFQDTFVPLGIAREEASKLSVALTSLTQDLSSFYNLSTTEVAERLTGTLVGNTENMRKFGVVINEAAISQELMNLGLAESSRKATQQQKIMAILSLIVQGTNDAVGDLKRSQDEFANTVRSSQAVVSQLKERLARELLPSLTPIVSAFTVFAANVGPRAIDILVGLARAFEPFAQAIAEALSTGNIENLLNLFIDALDSGITAAIDFLNSFIPAAFDWGANFIVEIANGIFDAASSILIEAVNFVGDVIASFLEPGSPTEEGPLSTIDQWAKGLIETFDEGFKAADFDFLEQTLASIADAFTKQNFPEIKQGLVELVDEINRTGDFNVATFEKVAAQIGENNKELVKTLELQLALQKARKAVLEIEDQVAEAERAGFVPAELRKKLDAARQEADQAEENLTLQQKFLDFQKLSLDDFQKATAAATGAAGKARTAGLKAARQAIDKQLEFVESGFAEEKRLLDEKLALGAISQEEYLQELIRLEEKYIDASQRQGLLSGLETHVQSLNNAKEQLAALRKEAKKPVGLGGAGAEGGLGDLIEQLTGDILSRSGALDIQEKVKKLGEDVSKTLVESIRDTFSERLPELGQTIFDGFSRTFANLGNQLRQRLGGENGLLVAAIGSVFIGAGADIIIGKIVAFATAVQGSIGGLTTLLRGLLVVGARWTIIGGAVLLVFQNWDKIVAGFNIVMAEATRIWGLFLENFGGGQKLIQDTQRAFEDITSGLSEVFAEVKQVVLDFITGDFVPTGKQLIASIFSGDLQAIRQNLEALINTIPIQDLFDALSLDNVNLASLQSLMTDIANAVGATFRQVLTGALGAEKFAEIEATFNQIRDQVIAVFSDERLGGPLRDLIADVIRLFKSLQPLLETVAKVAGGALLFALNGLVSAFQALVDTLPNIERTVRGIILIIDGLVQQFDGLIQILTGLGQLIIAVFTGQGFKQAFDTLRAGFNRFIEGINTSFGGILTSLEGIGGTIINFIINFGRNFIDNIVAFTEGTEVGQAFLKLRNRIIDFLSPIGDETGSLFNRAKAAVQAAAQAVAEFFSEGRLGGEVLLLFRSLYDAFVATVEAVQAMLVPIGGLLGLLGKLAKFIGSVLLKILNGLWRFIKLNLAPIIAVLVSGFQAVIDILPLIERALAGIIRIVRGVIDIFTGVTKVTTAFVEALIAIFTDRDFARANRLFQEGFEKLGEGVRNIFSGLLQTISNLGLAIIQAVISFALNLAAKILGIFGQTGQNLANSLLNQKNEIQNLLLDISDRVTEILLGLGDQIAQIFDLLGINLSEGIAGVGNSIATAFQNSGIGRLAGIAGDAVEKVYAPIIAKSPEAEGALNLLSGAAEASLSAHDKLGLKLSEVGGKVAESVSAYSNMGNEIFQTNRAIAQNEAALKNAEGAYEAQKIVVQKLEDALAEARRELLELARPNLAGLEEFDDKLFELDQSSKKLQLALLDLEEGTPTFESLKSELDRVNQEIDRVSLERDIAIEPQLRAIEKAATEGQEPLVTYDEAMAQIVAKKAEIEGLEGAFNRQTEALKPLAQAADIARAALAGVGEGFKPDALSTPAEQATSGIFNSFVRLKDDLVGNSVVPETANAIVLSFANMGLLVQQQASLLYSSLNGIFNAIRIAWQSNVQLMQTLWIQGITTIQGIAVAFEALALAILDRLRLEIERVKQAIDNARIALEEFIVVFGELAEMELEDIVEAFEKIADHMETARDRAEDFAKFLEKAKSAAEEISNNLGDNPGPGGQPSFQRGAFRVPRTMSALIHEGEMILPPALAEQFRSFLRSMGQTGIGSVSVPMPSPQSALMTNAANGDTIIINASFPNVTNAREARGIEQFLDQAVQRGKAFAAVGGKS